MAFYERQLQLIYVKQQCIENVKTTKGNHLHEGVDDPLENDRWLEHKPATFVSEYKIDQDSMAAVLV